MRMADLFKQFQLLCPDLTEAMENNTHHFSREKLNPYHIEGTTFTHTGMVCLMAEVLKTNDLVKIACLLHDVGKPISTRIDTEQEKVKMFGHEGLSVFLGLRFLNSLGLTDEQKVRVLQLISFHTFIYKAMRDEKTFESSVVDTFKGNAELLMDLLDMTACDALGRFTDGDEKRDFWMDIHKNLGHLIFKCDPPKLDPRKTQGEAIILVGPPNSGKSTWVKQNASDYRVLSRDAVILRKAKTENYNEAWKSVDANDVDSAYDAERKQVIKSESKIVFDLTHMTPKSRVRSLNGLPKDMKRTCVVFLTPFETLVLRDKKRTKEENKTIPAYALEKMMGSFTFPLITEGFDEIVYVFSEGSK